MRDRPSIVLSVGIVLILVGFSLPLALAFMRRLGIFAGPWGGFGPFVISLYLRPWFVGSGLLLIVLGSLAKHRAGR